MRPPYFSCLVLIYFNLFQLISSHVILFRHQVEGGLTSGAVCLGLQTGELELQLFLVS
jgi:hypothetical protein